MQNKWIAGYESRIMHNSKFIIHSSTILGIDPGYGRVGVAVIEKTDKGEKLLYSECFETDGKLPHPKRLLLIGEKVKEMIEKYNPKKIAVETLLWSKNKKTALQVAEARGVILLEAAKHGVFVCEYNPNQIKLAITGYGKSDKKQMVRMIEKLVEINPSCRPVNDRQKKYDDEYDAIAAALTCSATSLSTEKTF